jgi:hypothetical protein
MNPWPIIATLIDFMRVSSKAWVSGTKRNGSSPHGTSETLDLTSDPVCILVKGHFF